MTEDEFAEQRDTMTLLERINTRRHLDHRAGITYTAPTANNTRRLAAILEPGLRRLTA